MSWRRKWRNRNGSKNHKGGKGIVIVRTILWIGEMGSGNMLFFGLLHRMNTMRKSLPANNYRFGYTH